LAVLLSSCHYEDRGFASCVVAHALTLEMRDRLTCAAAHGPGFPRRFDSVLDSSLDAACGGRSAQLVALAQNAARDGAAVIWHKHRWSYSPSVSTAPESFQHYGLSVLDERPEQRYISYWVDDSGVLRSARGRAADPRHAPEKWQVRSGNAG